jgi:hypothetical protein
MLLFSCPSSKAASLLLHLGMKILCKLLEVIADRSAMLSIKWHICSFPMEDWTLSGLVAFEYSSLAIFCFC